MSELRGLGGINQELAALGVTLVAVSVDPPSQTDPIIRKFQLPFEILSDESLVLTRSLGIVHERGGPGGEDIPLPAHVLIDRTGRVLWRYVADRIQNRESSADVLRNVEVALARP